MLRYDSGITAAELIAQIKDEADISYPIPDASYVRFYNEIMQALYSDIIDDERAASIEPDEYGTADLSDIAVANDCSPVAFGDVVKLYVDDVEMLRVGDIGSMVFERNVYCDAHDGTITYKTPLTPTTVPDSITVIYRARPSLSAAGTDHVCVPYQFLSLVMAYIRGEAYKLANEDALSAKWIGDFNAQLADFKAWCAAKNVRYGE